MPSLPAKPEAPATPREAQITDPKTSYFMRKPSGSKYRRARFELFRHRFQIVRMFLQSCRCTHQGTCKRKFLTSTKSSGGPVQSAVASCCFTTAMTHVQSTLKVRTQTKDLTEVGNRRLERLCDLQTSVLVAWEQGSWRLSNIEPLQKVLWLPTAQLRS